MNLQSLVGVELPIIQAPMAGVQCSALAVAVSNAGGWGRCRAPCSAPTPCARSWPRSGRRQTGRTTSISSATPRWPWTPGARQPGGTRSPHTTRNSVWTRGGAPGHPGAFQRRVGRRARGVPARRGELPLRTAVGRAAGAPLRAAVFTAGSVTVCGGSRRSSPGASPRPPPRCRAVRASRSSRGCSRCASSTRPSAARDSARPL
jgi:hypothetical protein